MGCDRRVPLAGQTEFSRSTAKMGRFPRAISRPITKPWPRHSYPALTQRSALFGFSVAAIGSVQRAAQLVAVAVHGDEHVGNIRVLYRLAGRINLKVLL